MRANALRIPIMLAAATLLAAPAQAQDPFEEILNNPDAIETRVDDVELPLKNPTEDELRQYLEAMRTVNLTTSMTLDSRGRRNATVTLPTGARLGAFEAPNGTKVEVKAGFVKRPGEREAVLRTLEVEPNRPMAMGPLRFNKMTLDSKGVLHFKLNLNLMGLDFWPQELTIEKIFKDRAGNMILKTGGSGLAGSFVPDIRIKPDGTVQRYDTGYWLFGWRGRGWKDIKVKGKKVKLPQTLPIKRWPPRVTDLLDWLPREGAIGARSGLAGVKPYLEGIPIAEMSTKFTARADRKRITLSDGRGHIDLKSANVEIVSNGRFRGRTYTTDKSKPNTFRVNGRLGGTVREPNLGSARIDDARFRVTGTHDTTLPFEDLDNVRLDARYRGSVSADLSRVRGDLPDSGHFEANRGVKLTSSGSGRVELRPLASGEKPRITLNKDNRFRVEVNGELGLVGFEMPGGVVSPRNDIVGRNNKPVFVGEGTLGNENGKLTARARFDLDGTTKKNGIVYILNGKRDDVSAVMTLKRGAHVTMTANSRVTMRGDLKGAGVVATADTRIRGRAINTKIKDGEVSAEIPGEIDINNRYALGSRYTTRNRPRGELAVRRAASSTTLSVRDEGGTFKIGNANTTGEVRGDIKPGTRFNLETGLMQPPTPDAGYLETAGHSRGEKKARFTANLVVGAGTLAYKDLAVSFNGSSKVDLSSAIGFRLNPATLVDADAPLGSDPMDVNLDLVLEFKKGDTIVRKRGSRVATIKLQGPSQIKVKTNLKVDPETGAPTLKELKNVDLVITAGGVDLVNILQPLGISAVSVGSRTTVRVRRARIQLRENGVRITHRGISVTIAPGTINVRTNGRSRP